MRADLRLAPPAVAAWLATWLVVGAPAAAPWASIAAWCLAILATLGVLALPRLSTPRRARVHRALPVVALTCAGVALVCTSAFALGHLRHPSGLGVGGPRSGEAEFTVTGIPKLSSAMAFGTAPGAPPRVTVDAVLDGFTGGGVATEAHSPTVVFVSAEPSALVIGATLRVRGTLTPLSPGESHEFLFFARGSPQVTSAPPWFLGWAEQLRSGFRQTTAALPGDGAALLAGLAIGDDSGVSASLTEAMTVSGLTHLTAVSGANCAIVVTAVMLVGGALGVGRRSRVAVSIGVLVLFVVLVTPEPSVLRAATMAVIVLVALALGRPSSGVPPLCLSVIVLLALDPWLSRSAGFALSVLATGGLLLLTRPLASVAARFMPRWLALAIAVPIAAQLACQPVLFLLAPQLTPYTLPANLLAEPAAAAVGVLGLVVCLLGVAAPGVAAVAAWLPWVPSAWIGAVARFFAAAPFAVVPVPDGALAAVVAVVLTVLLLVCLFISRSHPRLGSVCGLVALVSLLLGSGVIVGGALARDAAVPPDWQLAACDIGQGDAVLVRSRNQLALVDVGPDPEPLTDCLHRMKVQRIDLLILSHYDRDHVGGLSAVIGLVDRALVGPPDGAADERLLSDLRGGGADVIDAHRGMGGSFGDYRWDILWPRANAAISGNEASVTVLFSGPLRMLFLGDLGERAQDAVDSANSIGPVDLVKVAHHGSADQSEGLYLELHAIAGIVSVGLDNGYGHPTDRLLGILGRSGTRCLRTDLAGLIVVSGYSATLSVWTEKTVPP
jgi:competence protein ComEC